MNVDDVPEHDARGEGEGYVSRSAVFRDGSESVAGVRVWLGDDRYERTEESLVDPPELRALTPDERQVVRETTAPLLHDLAVTGMRLPDLREEARYACPADHVCAWIQEPDGQGASGISILTLVPQAERVSLLAEQIQNWAADQLHDAGRSPAGLARNTTDFRRMSRPATAPPAVGTTRTAPPRPDERVPEGDQQTTKR
jgi:hypothetical protein